MSFLRYKIKKSCNNDLDAEYLNPVDIHSPEGDASNATADISHDVDLVLGANHKVGVGGVD